MAEPRAFISFDVDNNSDHKVLFAGQAWHSKTPFSHEDWSAKEPMLSNQQTLYGVESAVMAPGYSTTSAPK